MSGSAGSPKDPEHLVVGHITKAHGTRGELLVWPLTDRPEAVFAEGNALVVGDEDGELGDDPIGVIVERSRPFKKGLLVKLADAEDRDAVAELIGRYLLIDAAVAEPLAEGEVFYHQLLGMRVEQVDGTLVGTVREVYENSPHDLLEVDGAEGRRHLVPFAEHLVVLVDVAARRLVIDPPPGLLEL